MTCPSIEQLECYVDDWLDVKEANEIKVHIENCKICQEIVAEFEQENELLKETLTSPTVSDQFTEHIMNQIQPYEQKKSGKKTWRIPLLVASMSLFLVGGVLLSPSFAQWASGIFSTDNIDEGVQHAIEEGMGQKVDISAADRSVTFKVDEMMMDASRIVFSYQLFNARGKVIPNRDVEYDAFVVDGNGDLIKDVGSTWNNLDDYGLIDLSLPDLDSMTGPLTVQLEVREINSLKGKWNLEIPLSVEQLEQYKEVTMLKESEIEAPHMNIRFKAITKNPSMIIFDYEMWYKEPYRTEVIEKIAQVKKEAEMGEEIASEFYMNNELNYIVRNKNEEILYTHPTSLSVQDSHSSFLGSQREVIGEYEGLQYKDEYAMFNKGTPKDVQIFGVERVIPASYTVEVNRKKLKEKSIDFSYKHHQGEIKEVEKVVDYYAKKSIIPIGKRSHVEIKLTTSNSEVPTSIRNWLLEDEKGQFHETSFSGSSDAGTLSIYDLEDIPEKFTLHLMSEGVYEEFEQPLTIKLQ